MLHLHKETLNILIFATFNLFMHFF